MITLILFVLVLVQVLKSMLRSGAASQVLEVILGWSLARLRLGLGLVQASSKLDLGLSLARSQANYYPTSSLYTTTFPLLSFEDKERTQYITHVVQTKG